MPWITFKSIEFKDDLVSKAGAPYSAYVLKAVKRGFEGEEDAPYEKILFEGRPVTVIEEGVARPGISVVQFFQKACKPGDLVIMRNVRKGKNWELDSVELGGKGRSKAADYVPLTKEQIADAQASSADFSDPTRPRTPQQAPLTYVPAA
jgi:hypothetical protein